MKYHDVEFAASFEIRGTKKWQKSNCILKTFKKQNKF